MQSFCLFDTWNLPRPLSVPVGRSAFAIGALLGFVGRPRRPCVPTAIAGPPLKIDNLHLSCLYRYAGIFVNSLVDIIYRRVFTPQHDAVDDRLPPAPARGVSSRTTAS